MNQCVFQFDDINFNDLKLFWDCFETMPEGNLTDEALMAHFPANLAPPSLESAPSPTPPLAHAPTPDPPPR